MGAAWDDGSVALSQVYMSGRFCEQLVERVLPPSDPERKHQPRSAIVVLNDYHLLGKRIVYSMMRASGFELFDYGRMDVDQVLAQVRADRIRVLLISVLMLPSDNRNRIRYRCFCSPPCMAPRNWGYPCKSTFPAVTMCWKDSSAYCRNTAPTTSTPSTTPPLRPRLGAAAPYSCPTARPMPATIRGLKARGGDSVPIIGVAISPFSLPVMQMGFDAYLDLIHEQPDRFQRLMQANEAYTVAWANAQLAAGATAICYFDPLSSCTNIPPALYRQTGQQVAKRTLARIQGPTATHLASGRIYPLAWVDDYLAQEA